MMSPNSMMILLISIQAALEQPDWMLEVYFGRGIMQMPAEWRASSTGIRCGGSVGVGEILKAHPAYKPPQPRVAVLRGPITIHTTKVEDTLKYARQAYADFFFHSSMIGETILHYRILSQLGGAGMGVVYEAEGLKMRRHGFVPRTSGQASDLRTNAN
jgi:hypothetical protein